MAGGGPGVEVRGGEGIRDVNDVERVRVAGSEIGSCFVISAL